MNPPFCFYYCSSFNSREKYWISISPRFLQSIREVLSTLTGIKSQSSPQTQLEAHSACHELIYMHWLYSTSPTHQRSEKLIQDIPSILLFPYPDHQLQKKTWRAWRTGYVSDVTNITWCTSQQVTEIPGDSGASESSEKFLAEFHDQLPHNFYLLWRFHV